MSDVLLFLGDFNDALNVLFKAQKIYKDFAEIEYRLAGLFFILSKKSYGIAHFISGMKIDYDYHCIVEQLFPMIYDLEEIQKLLVNYKKATE